MASPATAAVAASIKSVDPDATPGEVRRHLDTARAVWEEIGTTVGTTVTNTTRTTTMDTVMVMTTTTTRTVTVTGTTTTDTVRTTKSSFGSSEDMNQRSIFYFFNKNIVLTLIRLRYDMRDECHKNRRAVRS